MHPKGLALTTIMCGGLWGTAYFCIYFFLFIKILFIPIERRVVRGQKSERYGIIMLSVRRKSQVNGVSHFLGVGLAVLCCVGIVGLATLQRQRGKAT